jgi:predicted RNA-binding protein with RPS1 domain
MCLSLQRTRSGNPLSRFKVDDVSQAKVINIAKEDKKIGLSIRKLEEAEERICTEATLTMERKPPQPG